MIKVTSFCSQKQVYIDTHSFLDHQNLADLANQKSSLLIRDIIIFNIYLLLGLSKCLRSRVRALSLIVSSFSHSLTLPFIPFFFLWRLSESWQDLFLEACYSSLGFTSFTYTTERPRLSLEATGTPNLKTTIFET